MTLDISACLLWFQETALPPAIMRHCREIASPIACADENHQRGSTHGGESNSRRLWN